MKEITYDRMSHCELCAKKSKCGDHHVFDFRCKEFDPVEGASTLRLINSEVLKRRIIQTASKCNSDDSPKLFTLNEVLDIINKTPTGFDAISAYQMMNLKHEYAFAAGRDGEDWALLGDMALFECNIAEILLFRDEYLREIAENIEEYKRCGAEKREKQTE